jgi:hypothetical protein
VGQMKTSQTKKSIRLQRAFIKFQSGCNRRATILT